VTPDVVHITGLEHSYGRTQALRGVDLRVGAGECVALLGHRAHDPRSITAPVAALFVLAVSTAVVRLVS